MITDSRQTSIKNQLELNFDLDVKTAEQVVENRNKTAISVSDAKKSLMCGTKTEND